jgi:hypothetical protein
MLTAVHFLASSRNKFGDDDGDEVQGSERGILIVYPIMTKSSASHAAGSPAKKAKHGHNALDQLKEHTIVVSIGYS